MTQGRTKEPPGEDGHLGERKVSASSVLGAQRPPITRYRPAVVLGGVAGVALLVGLGFLIAFGGGHRPAPTPAPSPPETDPGQTAAPAAERLPATYGDLGPSPIGPGLAPAGAPAPASAQANPASGPAAPTPAGQDPAHQAELAARGSVPFFAGPAGVTGTSAPAPVAPPRSMGELAPEQAVVAGGDAKEAFIARAAATGRAGAPLIATPSLSPYEIKAGTVIAAALITGLNSDLPGMVIAQVTQPVYDHRTGRTVLIPQGARLIGKYDSQVGYGQNRVLLAWTRLIFPSGMSVALGAMTGADATGASGLSDQVDAHVPVLARAIGLSTLISIGGAAAQNSLNRGQDNLVLSDSAAGVASQASQVGQKLVERDLQRAPTLRIRPGFPVRVMVDKDFVLPPEADGF